MYIKQFHTEDLSKYTFLVTGAAGFIGSNIVEYLLTYKAGKVLALDNLSTGFLKNLDPFFSNPSFEFINADITDYEGCLKACSKIDFVLHQAALGSVPRSIKDPITTNQTNIDGFLNVLNAAKEQKVKRVVYAASSSVYGDSPVLPKTEDNIGKPLSPYAVTKLVNELYADVFGRIYGLQCTGLRYFNVFGPRQNPDGAYAAVIPKFISAILNNNSPLIEGDGRQTRDFTFVENVVQANIKAAFSPNYRGTNEVYNIAVGGRTSIGDLFTNLAEISGSNVKAVYTDTRAGDVRDSLADISKAKQFLNYNPEIDFKEGLEITFKWFKNNF